jgi:hypothetical protein
VHSGTRRGGGAGVPRRDLLRVTAAVVALAGAGSAAGCDLFGGARSTTSEVTPELTDLLAATVALGAAYDAAIARVPSLADRLTGLRDAHRAHAVALAQALSVAVPVSSGSSLEGGSDAPSTLAALAGLETTGRDAARTACLNASPRLASLVGDIAAARACHLEVLQ